MKKIPVFILSFFACMTMALCAHAADFTVNTPLPMGYAYKDYSAQITMGSGSNDGYTFAFESGSEPAGLSLSESGLISGIPKISGTSRVYIRISHTDGTSEVKEFTINIRPKRIRVNITANNTIYDGNPHSATVTCTDENGAPFTDATVSVLYNYEELDYITEAGSYLLSVKTASGCQVMQLTGDKHMNISSATGASNAFDSHNLFIVGYDGQPHVITATATPALAGVKVEYRKQGEENFTQTPPTLAGVYDVVASTTNKNYNSASVSATLTILEGSSTVVNFTVDNTEWTYNDGNTGVTVTPDKNDAVYSVKYLDASNNEVTPVNAGTYKIVIELDPNSSYTKGTVSTETLTIKPIELVFKATTKNFVYDGQEKNPGITVTPAGTNPELYSVAYKIQPADTVAPIKEAGKYKIAVTLTDSVNYKVSDSSDTEITVAKAPDTVTNMNYGNSPAAMIYKDTAHASDETWRENALNRLRNNRMFASDEFCPANCDKDIKYTLVNGIDLDSDPAALIVRDINNFEDPGFVADGQKKNGVLSPVTNINGLYKLTYTYSNDQSAERYVMHIGGKIGDTNGTGYVNATDANMLDKKNAEPNGVTEARVWDVNNDGMLTKEDANAIRQRFVSPLKDYYPWV